MTKKVLIIDDSAIIRRIVEAGFGDFDVTIHQATDGKDGLEKFHAVEPDLCITDIHMDPYDGFHMLERIAPKGSQTVFVLTTDLQEGIKTRLDALSFRPYLLIKPVTTEQIKNLVKAHFERNP